MKYQLVNMIKIKKEKELAEYIKYRLVDRINKKMKKKENKGIKRELRLVWKYWLVNEREE